MRGNSAAFRLAALLVLLTCFVWTTQGDKDEKDWQIALGANVEIPGVCRVCKWLIKRVRGSLHEAESKEEIREQLDVACQKASFLKRVCRFFVRKFADKLPDEISSSENDRTVCVHLKACRRKYLL
ncbi:prosaposin-like [Engraulis encrasicolus]|uniref:prosaposin-like n=1 Tax=Engraulis encrasicolus TaxID=184585 RepID=UPI002FD6643C